MSGHKIIKGSCGHIIQQCRCPGPHPEKILDEVCGKCKHGYMASPSAGIKLDDDDIDAPEFHDPPGHPMSHEQLAEAFNRRSERYRPPHRCPVCDGRGRVPRDFYGDTMNASKYIVCLSCAGVGVLWEPIS